MEVGSPEWIEASLAKLDSLERQRGEHEAALESALDPLTLKQHNDALERLDTEIKTLYAQLEAVADDDEDDDEAESDEVAPRVTQGDEEHSAPHAAAATPFAEADEAVASEPIQSAPVSDSPFGSPSPSPSPGGFDAAPMSFDDDLEPKGGGSKWAFLALVVVGGLGVGGYFAWQNMQAQKAKEQAKPEVGEQVTIEAAAVPKDTEEPNAAKGADATVSPTAEGLPKGSSSGGSGGSNGSNGSSGKKSDGKKTKPLEFKSSGDPLSG